MDAEIYWHSVRLATSTPRDHLWLSVSTPYGLQIMPKSELPRFSRRRVFRYVQVGDQVAKLTRASTGPYHRKLHKLSFQKLYSSLPSSDYHGWRRAK